MATDTITTRTCEVTVREDGILHYAVLPGVEASLAHQTTQLITLSQGKLRSRLGACLASLGGFFSRLPRLFAAQRRHMGGLPSWDKSW